MGTEHRHCPITTNTLVCATRQSFIFEIIEIILQQILHKSFSNSSVSFKSFLRPNNHRPKAWLNIETECISITCQIFIQCLPRKNIDSKQKNAGNFLEIQNASVERTRQNLQQTQQRQQQLALKRLKWKMFKQGEILLVLIHVFS